MGGRLQGARITVVGAGVVGLCVALELQARGAGVTLVDEEGSLASASAVAAGMIAPAFEAALEEPGQGRLELLRASRDLWVGAAEDVALVHRQGALWIAERGGEAELARVGNALNGEGARWEPLSPAAAQALSPGLTSEIAGAVFTQEDWRIDAVSALAGLSRRFAERGGVRRQAVMTDLEAETARADAVILCAGWGSRRFSDTVPEVAVLRPISGELVRFPGGPPLDGPVIRLAGGYLAPGENGVIAGASMAYGLQRRRVTPEGQARFAALARTFIPGLADAPYVGAAGVRAATPDGLPLVGPSSGGPHLATGFRRNGWLLAPLAAKITADQLAGRDPGPWAEALRPDRFG